MTQTPSPENVTPCRHMQGLLNKAADGKLRGIAKWYAWSHARRCSGCMAFLRRLEATLEALRGARETATDEALLQRLQDRARRLAEGSDRS